MTPTTALGLSIRLFMFEIRETGDSDIYLGPPERVRAETGGADHWVLKRRELLGFAIVNEKKRPHPWETYHQFSIKTLLSKQHTRINKRKQHTLPGGLLPSQKEAEYSFSGFIPTNKQTNKLGRLR